MTLCAATLDAGANRHKIAISSALSARPTGNVGGEKAVQKRQSRLNAAWRRWGARDRLVRAMIVNWAFGMAIGVFCALLILAFDFFGLRSLLWRSDALIPGAAMLCAAFAFTFGGVVCAAAVMSFGDDDWKGKPGGLRLRSARRPPLTPAPIAIDPLRRRV